jgi:hypothetical protein
MTAKITSTFQVLDVNEAKFRKNLNTIIEKLMRDAIEIWVRTALSIIPVWSAASHHTLQELASEAGIAISSAPVPNAPDRRSLGRASGFGGLFEDGEEWYFEYETTLNYLISNENGNPIGVLWGLRSPVPYNFRAISNEAAFEFIEKELGVRLPELLAENIVVNSFKRG